MRLKLFLLLLVMSLLAVISCSLKESYIYNRYVEHMVFDDEGQNFLKESSVLIEPEKAARLYSNGKLDVLKPNTKLKVIKKESELIYVETSEGEKGYIKNDKYSHGEKPYEDAEALAKQFEIYTTIKDALELYKGASKVIDSHLQWLSKDQFEQITNGMTYEEVIDIIGFEGELVSEAGIKGVLTHTVMYKFDGKGDLGANAVLIFQGEKLISKAQYGLK